ncbi:MAG: 1-acyl-sn-glycerol-3-phosphate acyltransferase [Clostridia bacterium]|nr:1-acyl-sn-glycerol-3-phosphate acyltransferase [Clostridia bacterium]
MKEPIFYRIIRRPLSFIFKAVYKPTVIGKELIPESGRIILAGNHTNYFDCLLVGCSTKRCVHYMAKDELLKGPLGFAFKALGIIPVNRRTKDRNALFTAVKTLKEDKVIGIFPEGTINKTEDVVMPFKFGAVKMSQEAESDIVPFAITGKYKPFKKSVKIRFFDPIRSGENLNETNDLLMKTVSGEIIREGEKK